jgi:uncharacterized repeat protein (TIGR01451 family)/fimbrial isopeptide formation D2 family protein
LIAYNAGGGVGTVTYSAIGGDGGDSAPTQGAHGPGGGGAGGVIFTTGTTPPGSATAGGVTGVTTTPTVDGAADGRHGARSATGFTGSLGSITPPTVCLPSVTKTYNPRTVAVGGTSTLTVVLTNPANVDATLQQALTDPVNAPVSITTASTTTAPVSSSGSGSGTCASTGVVVTGNGSVGFPTGYVIPANRTCTLSVQVTSSTAGAFVNTIPAGTATGGLRTRLTGSPIDLNAPSTADTLAVIDPTKSVVLQTDTAPTGVSVGDTLRYTITYSLPAGATTIANFQIWDILPAQVTKVGAAGTNVSVTPSGAGTNASVNAAYTGVSGATTSSLLATGATLAAGGSLVVTIDATINTGTAPGVNIDNLARAEGSGLTAVTGNGAGGGIPSDARNTAAANNITQTTNSTLGDPTRVVIAFIAPTLSKTFAPQHILPGAVAVLTISIGNSNSSDLTLTQALTDTLPTNVSVAATPNPTTTCTGTGTVTTTSNAVTLPATRTIPTGGCSVSVNVTSSTLGVFTNIIAAGALQTNAGAGPSASAPLTVLEPTKAVRLLLDADSSGGVSIGDTIQYQVIYNLPSGAPSIANFQIFDVLPSQVTYVASSLLVVPTGGGQTGVANAGYTGLATTATSATLLNAPVTLQAGGTITATFNATINNTAVAATPFDNTARGTGTGLPAISGNGTGGGLPSDADATAFGTPTPSALPQPNDTATTGQPTQVTVVTPQADLVVTKSQPSPATVNPGGTITFTVTVINNGPSAAQNVVVTDTLPTGTTFQSASNGGTQAAGVVTWNGTSTPALISLANGASQTFTVTVNAP